MSSFGRQKPQEKDWKYYAKRVNIGFALFCVFAFCLFSFYHNVTSLVFADNKTDLIENDLPTIASYFMGWDQQTADVILAIDTLRKHYTDPDTTHFLRDNKGDLSYVLEYLSNNPGQLKQLGLHQYSGMIDLVSDLSKYKDDIFSLLGEEGPQTYLVVLQNSAEKRPNGGFFGSFAIVTVDDGHITNVQLMDSYYPGKINPGITVQAPDRATNTFLDGDGTITFLASNKFGFTDIDGKNIETLYE